MTSPSKQWPNDRALRAGQTVRLSREKLSFTSCTRTAATFCAESAIGSTSPAAARNVQWKLLRLPGNPGGRKRG
jgi:hypothetical protein